MMNKVFLATLLFAMICACSTKTSANIGHNQESTLDTAALVQRVNDIYATVFDRYSNDHSDGIAINETSPSVDSLYTSRDWKDMLAAVRVIDNSPSHEDMIGFFEADYWIMGQDWQDLSISDIQVMEMTDSTATVVFNLHNFGNATVVRLEMVKEDGEWKIDDFIDVSNDFDWKAGMKEYVANETTNN